MQKQNCFNQLTEVLKSSKINLLKLLREHKFHQQVGTINFG